MTDVSYEECISSTGEKMIKVTDSEGRVSIYPYPTFDTLIDTTSISDRGLRHGIGLPNMSDSVDIIKEMDTVKMNVNKERDIKSNDHKYRVSCNDIHDLSEGKILKTLSVMKGRLMMECAPVHVRRVECKMTSAVKDNIIRAFRRINMYGKKTPFVARFDEYGRRLDDEVKIETLEGMIIKVIDANDYGPLYLEFEGIVSDTYYEPYYRKTFTSTVELEPYIMGSTYRNTFLT